MRKKWISPRIALCLNVLALASTALMAKPRELRFSEPVVEDGAVFFLNQSGLDLLADEIRQRQLSPVRDYPIDDFSTRISYGFTFNVEAKGLSFSTDFPSLKLTASEQGLKTRLGLRYVMIKIDELEVSKRVIVRLSTTCKDIRVAVAVDEEGHFAANMPLWVDDGKIDLALDHAKFFIPEKDFQVHGPQTCSGPFGIGYLLSSIVHRALSSSREKIAEAVAEKAEEIAPTLAAKLNDLTHQDFPIRLSMHADLPPMASKIKVIPSFAQVDQDGFRASFKAAPRLFRSFLRNKSSAVKIGYSGFNLDALSEVIKLWFEEIGYSVAAGELVPEINEILTEEVCNLVWPDLRHRRLDSKHMRLYFDLPEALKFSVGDNQISLVDNDLVLRFQIRQKGQWMDYYAIHSKFTMPLRISFRDGYLDLGLNQVSYEYMGEWLTNPYDNRAEFSRLHKVVGLAFDNLIKRPTILSIKIPVFDSGYNQIQVSGLSLSPPSSLIFEFSHLKPAWRNRSK